MFTVEEYVRGLEKLRPRISVNQVEMLFLHYSAPFRTITALQMSQALGWSGRAAANVHYGKLGKTLANAIGQPIKPWHNGGQYPLRVLAEFHGGGDVDWEMWPDLAQALEITGIVKSQKTFGLADELTLDEINYGFLEGRTYAVLVNLYERSSSARDACIQHHGTNCKVCDLDFSSVYGDSMEGFIHVHHLKPLSEIGEKYKVNPIEDLIPVCPNCHAVIHSRRPAYSPDEVRSMLRKGAPS
jgi:5-methylcytosine-specific restriction enzyme A